MRLFLLPISARRTLIYCDKSVVAKNGSAKQPQPPGQKSSQSLLDRATTKAANTWTEWERAKGGWKKTLTTYGNALLRRIPYEEWGLKSFPPLTTKLKEAYETGKRSGPIPVIYPSAFLPKLKVGHVLSKLASERQDLHWKRMIGSAIGAPLTLPFALVPM
jgi:Mitochondrial K+-H+ exchange-related